MNKNDGRVDLFVVVRQAQARYRMVSSSPSRVYCRLASPWSVAWRCLRWAGLEVEERLATRFGSRGIALFFVCGSVGRPNFLESGWERTASTVGEVP